MKIITSLVVTLIVLGLFSGNSAQASSTYYAIDPGARTVLNQMQTAYSSLKSLSEEIVAQESPTLPHYLVVHTSLKLLRPGDLIMISDSQSSRSGASEVVTDGSFCYVTAPQYPSRYLKFPVSADSRAYQGAISEGILSSLTLSLFADPTTVSNLFPDSNLATLQLAHPVKIDGEATNIVVISDRNGVTLTLSIGQKDHLIRKISIIDPNKPGTFTESYTSVAANPALSPQLFKFAPSPNTDAYLSSSFDQPQQ